MTPARVAPCAGQRCLLAWIGQVEQSSTAAESVLCCRRSHAPPTLVLPPSVSVHWLQWLLQVESLRKMRRRAMPCVRMVSLRGCRLESFFTKTASSGAPKRKVSVGLRLAACLPWLFTGICVAAAGGTQLVKIVTAMLRE